MIDREHLARLEAAADTSRAVLDQLEGQAVSIASRRDALEARRIRAALPAAGLEPTAADVAGGTAADDLAAIDAELTAAAGLSDATAAKLASERETLASVEAEAARLRAVQGLADACQAKADAFASLAGAWLALLPAIDAVLAAETTAARAVTAAHGKDGSRAQHWPGLLSATSGMTTSRRLALSKAASAAKDAARELATRGARISTLPTLEADALRADASHRKDEAA